MPNRLVSVIVPTKNSSEFLDACLESIKNQTYKNIELIVVDNNSADATKEIARKYTDKVFNHGPERSAQRNLGAKNAVGEFFLFIDSDMELEKEVAEECVKKTQDTGAAGVIIPEESFGKGFWAQCKKLERSFYVGLDSVEAARFFRKADLDAAHGYNEALVAGEDWDLSDRIEMRGTLARTSSFIRHNEGRINLRQTLKKKYYYAQKASGYIAHSSGIPTAKKRKQGIIGRYTILFKHPVKLFKNPIIGIGMLFMKTCEFGAGATGILKTHI